MADSIGKDPEAKEPAAAAVSSEDETKAVETAAATAPLKGRAALLDRYKKAHEGESGEPDDEALADYAVSALDERDDYKSRYEAFDESNRKLIDAIRENPSVAEFIARISRGEDPIRSIGVAFGDLREVLDEASLKRLDEGAEERKGQYDRVRSNFENYAKTLDAYGAKNGLSEGEKEEIHNAIIGFATDLSEGRIDEATIDFFHKALTYDEEKTAELNAAELAGRNAAIDEVKSRRSAKATELMPDVTSDKSLPHPEESYYYEPEQGNISDELKDKE